MEILRYFLILMLRIAILVPAILLTKWLLFLISANSTLWMLIFLSFWFSRLLDPYFPFKESDEAIL